METKFDPDDVDVTGDPEYAARVGAPGPMHNVQWAVDDKISSAKRLEMLDIDREMNDAWLAAMEKLLVKGLPDAEFTTERMLRLRLWTKERKRRQHNLHYKYDPSRRNFRLVNRDVDRQLAKLRAQMDALYTRRPDIAPEGWVPSTEQPAITARKAPVRAATPGRAPDRRPLADIILTPQQDSEPQATEAAVADTVEDMVRRDIGIANLNAATDDEILDAYADLTSVPEQVARWYLAKLRGRPLPELMID
ncbi:MAG: hypothetical protein ACOH14_07695 [Rhodoglobus sp.]